MGNLKIPISFTGFAFACFVLTSSNAFAPLLEVSIFKGFRFFCAIVLVVIVMTGHTIFKAISLPLVITFLVAYLLDIFFGILIFGFDKEIIFYLVKNLVGVVLLFLIISQVRIMKSLNEQIILKTLIFMACFSIFTPYILMETGAISPDRRYIYFGDRYAGFSWELTSIVFILILTSLIFVQTKINILYKCAFFSLISASYYLNVYSNFVILSMYILSISFIVSYQKFYFNRLVFLLGAFLTQMWEVFIITFLDFLSLVSVLKINSGNGRVLGRVEAAAAHNVLEGVFTLTIYQNLLSTSEAGVDSFQHGINQFTSVSMACFYWFLFT